jgi:dGTPase
LRRLDLLAPRSADAVRESGSPVIAFSARMTAADQAIKAVLRSNVYRHARVLDVMIRAEQVVSRLFQRYIADSSAMPLEWRPQPGPDDRRRARRVADFLAGMTDRYALGEYRRLFDESAELG